MEEQSIVELKAALEYVNRQVDRIHNYLGGRTPNANDRRQIIYWMNAKDKLEQVIEVKIVNLVQGD